VGEIVVDSVLHHCEIVGFRHGFDVEELADGLEVGESRAQGLSADGIESSAEVQAARERVNGNVDACHDGWWVVDRGGRFVGEIS